MSDPHVRVLSTLAVEGKSYRVLAYELVEALAEPGFAACEVYDDDAPLPLPEEVIGRRARLTLSRSDGAQERAFDGTIVEAELAPDEDDVPALRLRVEPLLFRPGLRADCRIFQDKSGPDLVKEVLIEAGVPAGRQHWLLVESHPVRPYTVQYRETDLDFIQRILFEEGIYYAVRPGDGGETIAFCDHPDGMGEIAGATTLTFFEDFGFEGGADRVVHVSQTAAVRSDKAYLRDYDPERPSFTVEGKAEGTDEGPHTLEIYEYPARSTDDAEVERRTQVLLESVQAERDVIQGETGSLALAPGLRFTLEGHPYEPLNQELMVTRSRITGTDPSSFQAHVGRKPTYACAFWGVPTKTTRYRPPRRLRSAALPGAQTAVVCGAGGEEIHTDGSAQVKASFHWDRSGQKDENASRWIRTSQLTLGGSMLLPRVGWEVAVRHEGGDPDRPMVMGRMYNALTPPPYALPGGAAKSALQTATSPGGGSANELRMSDTKGAEEMFLGGSRDMSTDVKNNATESVANDHKKTVGGNQTESVTNSLTSAIGANQSIEIGGDQSINIETFHVDEVMGDHTLTIGGNRDLKVGGDHRVSVGGSSTTETGSNHIELVVGAVSHETLASLDHTVGTALVELAVGTRTVNVGGDRSEAIGLAKLIATRSGRGVDVGGSLDVKAVGAVAHVGSADRVEQSGGTFTELAVGAQIVKAGGNVTFEASGLLTLVMGASVLSLTPASVAVLGLSAKLDGEVTDLSIVVIDN
ncbi:type VI secretion system Vgr family protein [Chondromyces crocatus]|uniref:Uncharacterized protein n=1 Tax=Chondromyces crocatus TaxID=52 RepID=A0A0K1E8W1_CHOCO|nr:type VI secretion system tip protein TssI/VgrG [Chondromyces crocatus]AKT37018.1 uncharacterized protein CMC5_011440 [Chondromyces crocatus]